VKFQSFRRRLLWRLSVLALVAMLLASAVQVVLITREQKREHDQLQTQMTFTQIPLLQTALWDIETAALRLQLARIAELQSVAAVRLRSETGLELQQGDTHLDGREADLLLIIPSPLPGGQQLGVLEVFYRHDLLAQLITRSIVQRVLEFSLYTLLLFMVLFRALHREVGRPLQVIAEYVAALKPEKDAPRLKLSRPQRDWYDEIDLVSAGFDTLHQGISHHADQHERAIAALAQERDSLDQRVAERTAELAYLNGYLKLIAGSSLKLMHLTHSQYPQAMTRRLRAIAHYLQLDACALLDRHDHENCVLRASWMREQDDGWIDGCLSAEHWSGERGWSVVKVNGPTLLIRFVSPERSFCFAARSRSVNRQSAVNLEALLLGAGQWLFSLVQHWDHVIGLEEARQELIQLSRTDPMTGLANRRHFEEHQLGELRRALRLEYPISLLMIDVDYFKGFNDRYGHAAGDDCLKSLARVLDSSFKRAGELPARMGGEEFAVFLPGYDLEAAAAVAESLRKAIEALDILHQGSPWGRVTASMGCASWSGFGEPSEVMETLLKTADGMLYEAKRLGRNRVISEIDRKLA
jgi:diguanylate cyclase (GGDEF)-like protein